ncbi:tetratricopeptide repeat protein [Gilliamella sp. Pas-s27]|uniref:tetratricopeptide repeat protein n=1 Tax=Gilliamella sp. Pas-s27 TaxID=2687311 RepID=UPI001365DD84|nr:tetratricopeptide repeat protein [Gilliamella sp. Pas-s27]
MADTNNESNLIIQAENGDKIAQYSLANLLLSHSIDEKYDDRVFYWYQQSAQQGYAQAQFALAIIYEEQGNSEQAIIWLEKAAKQNHVQSQYSLGVNYRFGFLGVKLDNSKALYWLTKAAKQGYTAAQVELGNLYLTSSEIDTDYKKGIDWYKKATEANNPFAQLNLGIIEKAQSNYKTALLWFERACKNNLTDGCQLASEMIAKKQQ